jgi:hypothetical protein
MRGETLVGKLNVSTPRRPCAKVDQLHLQKYGARGVRQFTAEVRTASPPLQTPPSSLPDLTSGH